MQNKMNSDAATAAEGRSNKTPNVAAKEAPVNIRISDLEDHPDNPGRVYREEVVAAIAGQLNGKFPACHSILVRRMANGKYQIVAGHNRRDAAERAGLSQISAWIVDVTDEEAYMQLVQSNAQSELYPLERGMHALGATQKGKHGLSIKAYAERVGRPEPTVNQEVRAARVASSCPGVNFEQLVDRTKHLAEIHAAPQVCWQAMVQRLLKDDWTALDTQAAVRRVNDASVPAEYEAYFDIAKLQVLFANDVDAEDHVARMIDAIHEAEKLVRDQAPGLRHHLKNLLEGALPCEPPEILTKVQRLVIASSGTEQGTPVTIENESEIGTAPSDLSRLAPERIRTISKRRRGDLSLARSRKTRKAAPRTIVVPTDPQKLASRVILLLGGAKARQVAEAILKELPEAESKG